MVSIKWNIMRISSYNLTILKFEDVMKIDQVMHSFRYVSIESYFEGNGLVNTTINWLTWMSNIRILNIDNELLSQLVLNNFTIDQFLLLEILIVRQLKNSVDHELITIINRLGRSSSLFSYSTTTI